MPSGAQTRNMPVQSRIRPLQTAELFGQMFNNFYTAQINITLGELLSQPSAL
jgi:hypothetical protein